MSDRALIRSARVSIFERDQNHLAAIFPRKHIDDYIVRDHDLLSTELAYFKAFDTTRVFASVFS